MNTTYYSPFVNKPKFKLAFIRHLQSVGVDRIRLTQFNKSYNMLGIYVAGIHIGALRVFRELLDTVYSQQECDWSALEDVPIVVWSCLGEISASSSKRRLLQVHRFVAENPSLARSLAIVLSDISCSCPFCYRTHSSCCASCFAEIARFDLPKWLIWRTAAEDILCADCRSIICRVMVSLTYKVLTLQ